MKAIILCAGRGTRLGELTRDLPKPMLPLDGTPVLEHMLRHLRAQGVVDVAINLHHHPEAIVERFGDGRDLDLRITYSWEEQLLGTAGAVRRLAPWIGDDEEVLVAYGDVITDQAIAPLVAAHRASRALATLLVHRRRRSNSLVELDANGRIVAFVERPDASELPETGRHWVNSGFQLLSRRALRWIPPGVDVDLPRDVYARIVDREVLAGVPLSGFRCAIDSPERYAEAIAALRSGRFVPIEAHEPQV